MRRRRFLGYLLNLIGLAALGTSTSRAASRVRPGSPGWPSDAAWNTLRQAVGGKLQRVEKPAFDPAAQHLLSNPFYLGDQAALTQVSGWLDGWQSAPSAYAVQAESAADVAEAVRFARANHVRLVVKGGGHSYLGGSNAPDSLLIWTRAMKAITVHDGFTPAGSMADPVPAVSVGAGCLWLHAYEAVTTQAGRYVQGGGCTTVGIAGHVQGGGFGSWSKAYGLAAASLLEAEIVTADGAIRVVNANREPDLFWALKGGGGGTFGVITRLTLRTHPLPSLFGAVRYTVQANSDAAYRALLARFLACYASNLHNPHWGEQARATHDNRLVIEMVFQGLDAATAKAAWQDLVQFVDDHPKDYKTTLPLLALALPAQHFWDAAFLNAHAPGAVTMDERAGASATDYWWTGDGGQAGALWLSYTSAWLPASLLDPASQAGLAGSWFDASRHWSVSLHFNKGLAGAAPDALAASRDTAMNPDVLNAFALAIIAGEGPSTFANPAPDLAGARQDAARIQSAMAALRKAAPDTGSYLSECDYFEAGWQQASWGAHYDKLGRIKHTYDPDGLFFVRHGVGSEDWAADGFTRLAGP